MHRRGGRAGGICKTACQKGVQASGEGTRPQYQVLKSPQLCVEGRLANHCRLGRQGCVGILVEVGLADGGAQAVPGLAPRVDAARRLDHGADGQVAVLHAGTRDKVGGGEGRAGEGGLRPQRMYIKQQEGAREVTRGLLLRRCCCCCWRRRRRLTCVLTSPVVTPVKPAKAACTALWASTLQ